MRVSPQPIPAESFDLTTQADAQVVLAPKAVRDRIAMLDILRGIAILLIFLLNVPNMGNTIYEYFGDARLLGWQPADQACYWFLSIFVTGTQAGLLQFLFGAGALILLERTLAPNGPVAVFDLYLRRNFFLALFGLFDLFGLLWFGDILLPYAVAALLLFPLRRLGPPFLLILGFAYVSVNVAQHAAAYQQQAAVQVNAREAARKASSGAPLTQGDKAALAAREKQLSPYHFPTPVLTAERAARTGPVSGYVRWLTGQSLKFDIPPGIERVSEIAFSMAIGMALFKLRITQGGRSARFYAALALLAYLPGLALRADRTFVAVQFQALPNPAAIFAEPARLLVTTGHLALINLLAKTVSGRRLLAPFKAAGRMAFSLYLMQNFLSMWILFPAFALGLYGRFHWFGLTMLAFGMMAFQLVFANLWLRVFVIGPMEWLWRSLTYARLQPFRHTRTRPQAVVV